MKRLKILIPTITTGIILGLVALLIWSASFKLVPSKRVENILESQPHSSVKHTPIQNQFYLAGQVQAFIQPVAQANYLPIRNFNISEPDFSAKAVGLYDIGSDRFLFTKNIDDKLPVASITKLMTAVVVMENLGLNDLYTIHAEDLNADGTGTDFHKGEQLQGGDLLKVMLIKSSNDAALAFASNALDKNINVVAKMNEKAQTLGMYDTKYIDPAGLNDNGSFSTVSDLVKLTRYVSKYPIIWEILSLRTADVVSIDGKYSHHLVNTNKLLEEMPEIIGGKTGFTNGAMETMVLEVKTNEGKDRMIAVILGSNDRFGEIKKLVEWGKNAFSWQ